MAFGRRALPVLASAFLPLPAFAQESWPTRPVRIVVPFTPGGPVDLVARLIADRLRDRLGQPVLVENRPGAGGSLGVRMVSQAPPDGTLLLLTSGALAIGPALHSGPGLDPRSDLAPISLLNEIATTIVTRADSRFASFTDLLREARARPGTITYGSSGIGSSNHLAGAMLAAVARIELVHVPYRGAAVATNALLARDIDLVFASTVETLPAHRDGRVRTLAVTTPARIAVLPEVPAAIEFVPGYVAPNWYAMAAPRGLPAHILARLSAELALLRDDADLRARMASLGTEPVMSSPEVLAARLATEVPHWQRVAAEAGIRAE